MGLTDAEECRRAAKECREEAERTVSPIERERWLKLAAEWDGLAQRAEQMRR
jgi:hypothetical protein